MTRKPPLRALSPDEKPHEFETVAASLAGSPRDVNLAMQRRIAAAIDDTGIRGADLAALSRRLIELRKELAALDVQAKEAGEDAGVVVDADWQAV